MYENVGADILRNNKFAVVTMSGGQGTRLGYKGPKGTFKIDVEPQAKYLFEIIVDTLQRANKKYNVTIPWYIMTSNENNDEIVKFCKLIFSSAFILNKLHITCDSPNKISPSSSLASIMSCGNSEYSITFTFPS